MGFVAFCSSFRTAVKTLGLEKARSVVYYFVPESLITEDQHKYLKEERNKLIKWASTRFHDKEEFEAFLLGWCVEAEYYGFTEYAVNTQVMNDVFDEEEANKCFEFWKDKFQHLNAILADSNS